VSKKIRLLGVGVLVFVVVLVAFAGSALAATYTPGLHSNLNGGPHDLSTSDPCSVCHVTHGAGQQGYLWAEAISPTAANAIWPTNVPSWPRDWDTTLYQAGAVSSSSLKSSDIYLLCYSCHDGTGLGPTGVGNTEVGKYTTMDLTKGMHRMRSATFQQAAKTAGGKGTALTASYGRDCDRCHDPHEDTSVRPNFIRYYEMGTQGTTNSDGTSAEVVLNTGANICASCHSDSLSDGTHFNHWVSTVPTNGHGTVAVANAKGLPINPAMVVLSAATGGTRLFSGALENATSTNYLGVTGSPSHVGNHRLGLAALASGAWPTDAVVKCESCHAPHGGAPIISTDMTFTVVTSGTSKNPVFNGWKDLTFNTMNPAAGALCTNCHQ
jgi:hypothetical protein